MLAYYHLSLGDGPVTLATCLSDPRGCDETRLAQILDGLQCGCPPDATVIKLLSDGMSVGDPVFGTNRFFANPAVMRAMRANAPANPDLAIVVVIKAIDDVIADGRTITDDDADDRGFLAESIHVLADSVPKAQSDSQARGILKLKDLAVLTQTLPGTAIRAIAALQGIQLPSKAPPGATPPGGGPAVTSTPFVLSTNAKTALMVITSVVAVGGSVFLIWRLGRSAGPSYRLAPAVGRRLRVR